PPANARGTYQGRTFAGERSLRVNAEAQISGPRRLVPISLKPHSSRPRLLLSTRTEHAGGHGFVRHPCAISSFFGSTELNAGGIIIRVSGVRVPPPALSLALASPSKGMCAQRGPPGFVVTPAIRLGALLTDFAASPSPGPLVTRSWGSGLQDRVEQSGVRRQVAPSRAADRALVDRHSVPARHRAVDQLRLSPHLTALFTSAPIFFSSAAVRPFSAKEVGHIAPW